MSFSVSRKRSWSVLSLAMAVVPSGNKNPGLSAGVFVRRPWLALVALGLLPALLAGLLLPALARLLSLLARLVFLPTLLAALSGLLVLLAALVGILVLVGHRCFLLLKGQPFAQRDVPTAGARAI